MRTNPNPVSSPRVSLKSLAASEVGETSTGPSKLNLAGQQAGQGKLWLARHLGQCLSEHHQVFCRGRGSARQPRRGAQLVRTSREGQPAAPGLQRHVDGMTGVGPGTHAQIELHRRVVEDCVSGHRERSVDRTDRGVELGFFGHHGKTGSRIVEGQRTVLDDEPAERQGSRRGRPSSPPAWFLRPRA